MRRTIWLASYPKSGHTWFRILVANLSAKESEPVDINNLPSSAAGAREPFEYLSLIDSGALTDDEIDCLRPRVYEGLTRGADDDGAHAARPVRFMSVHDAYMLTPKGEPLFAAGAEGAILIVRDPRDVACSLAHYNRMNIDDAIAFMNSRERDVHSSSGQLLALFRQRPRGWSGLAESWLEQTDIPVHLVRYEDMKKDTVGSFRGALEFARSAATEDDIQRAVSLSDFSRLRSQEEEKGFRELPWPHLGGRRFFRRGAAGGWRDELNAEQVARIESAHGPMMRRLGYDLTGTTLATGPAQQRVLAHGR